jgi:hypothetical protein
MVLLLIILHFFLELDLLEEYFLCLLHHNQFLAHLQNHHHQNHQVVPLLPVNYKDYQYDHLLHHLLMLYLKKLHQHHP